MPYVCLSLVLLSVNFRFSVVSCLHGFFSIETCEDVHVGLKLRSIKQIHVFMYLEK